MTLKVCSAQASAVNAVNCAVIAVSCAVIPANPLISLKVSHAARGYPRLSQLGQRRTTLQSRSGQIESSSGQIEPSSGQIEPSSGQIGPSSGQFVPSSGQFAPNSENAGANTTQSARYIAPQPERLSLKMTPPPRPADAEATMLEFCLIDWHTIIRAVANPEQSGGPNPEQPRPNPEQSGGPNPEQSASYSEQSKTLAAEVRGKAKAPKDLVEAAVLALCAEGFVERKALADTLDRAAPTLRTHHLDRLVSTGLLEPRNPDTKYDPRPAHRTTESGRTRLQALLSSSHISMFTSEPK